MSSGRPASISDKPPSTPFPHPGPYRFEITIDGDRKASVPLTVSQLPALPAGGSH